MTAASQEAAIAADFVRNVAESSQRECIMSVTAVLVMDTMTRNCIKAANEAHQGSVSQQAACKVTAASQEAATAAVSGEDASESSEGEDTPSHFAGLVLHIWWV